MILSAVITVILHSPIRLSTTPEATLRSVVEGINQRNPDSLIAAYAIVRPNAKPYLEKIFAEMKGTLPVYSIQSLTVAEMGETATAKVKVSMSGSQSALPEETVNLLKQSGDWKISNREAKVGPEGIYAGLGAFLKNPEVMPAARQAAAATTVLSNMKQIAVACMLLAGDNDDKFPVSTATLRTKLYPYVKTDKVFKDASGKPLPLEFNPNLTGKKQTDVRKPAETVMFSLGPKGKLVFTDDRTPIAFVDGHVKYVSRADAAKLNWNL